MTGWKSRTNAGIFIAASDSSAKDKAVADYVCDGVNDEVEALAAIAALPATGGVIEFASGTFIRGADIAITKGNIQIIGQGKSTIWKMKDSTNVAGQIFSATSIDGIAIENMVVDGNEANNTTTGYQYGINFQNCTNLNVDCWIENCLTCDLVVNNIETCGKIKNRNYDDEYTPRIKTLLDIDGSNWTTISGIATLTQNADAIVGDTSLHVEIAPSGTVIIEHDMVCDLRHYPIIKILLKLPELGHRLPDGTITVSLVDANDTVVSTTANNYDFALMDVFLDGLDDEARTWHWATIDVNQFGWTNNHSILANIAKIRFAIVASAIGTNIQFNRIEALRGLQRPVVTLMFDDGSKNQHDVALKILSTSGYRGVIAVNSHRLGLLAGDTTWQNDSPNPSYDMLDWADLPDFRRAGWDISTHTASHASTALCGSYAVNSGYESRVVWEHVANVAALEHHNLSQGSRFYGHAGSSIASFEGAWANCLVAGRTGYPGHNLPYENNVRQLRYTPSSSFSTDDINSISKFHLWGISIYHAIDTSPTPAGLKSILDRIRARGVEVMTFTDIFNLYPLVQPHAEISFSRQSHTDSFLNLLAADTDYIHSGIVGTGSEQTVTSGITQPDHPRNLTISCTNVGSPSGYVFVYGKDARGYTLAQRVTIVAGGTVSLTAAFASVTSIVIPATVSNQDTITVGIGDWLGLSRWILNHTDVISITRNGVAIPVTEDLFIVKAGLVSWESTVNLGTITVDDDVVIRYRTNM